MTRYVLATIVLTFSSATTLAGDLNPPGGPVAPTMKTLDQVEPRIPVGPLTTPGDANDLYIIPAAGSYYLTGDIVGVAGKNGININADNVTLDLCGFRMVGGGGTLDGIMSNFALRSVIVRNGSVRSWGQEGVSLPLNSGLIEEIGAVLNGETGIQAGTAIVRNCVATNNGTNANATWRGGIRVSSFARVENCLARDNGDIGIGTGSACTISGCISVGNAESGIWTTFDCTVSDCTARSNGWEGFRSNGSVVIRGCSAAENGRDGFLLSASSVASDCAAYSNGGDGFEGSAGVSISGCTAERNTANGIRIVSECHVFENTCYQNGFNAGVGAGISAISENNRIESNNLTRNDTGLNITGAGNLIIKNTASDNTTNYVIAAGNSTGLILNVSGIAINTSNAWRNLEY